MIKNIGMLMVLVSCAACGGAKNTPSDVEKKKNVYHVFDQNIKKDEEVGQNEKIQSNEKETKKEVTTTVETAEKTVKNNSPLAVIQQYTSELQALDIETKNASNRDQQISSKVRRFFDFDTLAKESLGSYWHQINKHDQQEYSDLFISLIERSYLARSKTLVGNYDLVFQNEKIVRDKSSVECVVKKDDVDIDIVYHLHKKNNGWMIYNIVFDDVDLIKNYQSQFGRIIEKQKFSGLVSTMRKKLNASETAVNL